MGSSYRNVVLPVLMVVLVLLVQGSAITCAGAAEGNVAATQNVTSSNGSGGSRG